MTDPRIPNPTEIAKRLSGAQRNAILRLNERYQLARDLGTTGATLMSMTDLWRGERGVQPPIMLTCWDVDDHEMVRVWSLTGLGMAVQEVLQAAA